MPTTETADDAESQDTVTVEFIPQAWLRHEDRAVEIESPGPDTFEVPRDEATDEDGTLLSETGHYHDLDALKWHDNAPEWIEDWSGPFKIRLEG